LQIANATDPAVFRPQCRLPDHGQDGACDDVPVVADRKRDHRLDVEDILRALLRSEVEIGIVLKRNADQVTDRILRNLGEVLGTHFCMQGRREHHRGAKCGQKYSQMDSLDHVLLFHSTTLRKN
jgi:hypothetical protein